MTDYGSPLEFGISVTPEAANIRAIADVTRATDGSDNVVQSPNVRFIWSRVAAALAGMAGGRSGIGPQVGGQGLNGPALLWVETLTSWVSDLGFDTFVFWPTAPSEQQVRLFAEDVVPQVRALVNASSTRSTTS